MEFRGHARRRLRLRPPRLMHPAAAVGETRAVDHRSREKSARLVCVKQHNALLRARSLSVCLWARGFLYLSSLVANYSNPFFLFCTLEIQSGAATCSEGFVTCFPGCWAVLQLPCCPIKQGELSEYKEQNLRNKLPPQTVEL